ncbi:MAG: galactokinase [Sphaerochaetaceae bacterium]
MDKIVELHAKEYEQKPQVLCEVPGVCTLFGSFADFCNGWSIVGTAQTTLTVAVSKRDDQMVRLYNATVNDRKRFSLSNIKFRKEDRWGNFIKGVVSIMSGENHPFCGLNLTVEGSLLLGDPMSISTAVSLGTCLVLNKLFDLKLDNSTIIRIAYQSNVAFNNESCRISDLIAMLSFRPNRLLFFDLLSVSYQEISFPFGDSDADYVAVLLDSKISPIAMREEIKSKRLAAKKAFDALRKFKPSGAIRDFPEGDLHARMIPLPENERHICTYVLMESHITNDASFMIQQHEVVNLGKAMNRIQNGLRDLMEMTCPEVDWLIKRASETTGCLGAVQIANGLSGNILLLLSKEALPRYISRLEDYEHIFGFHPKYYIYQSQGGAKVMFPED